MGESRLSLATYRPSPERLWIRYRPRRWPSPSQPWTDWSRAGLGSPPAGPVVLPRDDGRALDDVLYVPPVDSAMEAERRRWTEGRVAAGTPVLVQARAGVDSPERAPKGAAWDLLPTLLTGDPGPLRELPPGSAAVWPLISGVTDGAGTIERGLEALQHAKVEVVQGLVLELAPAVRRQLAETGDEATFDRLFHGSPPSARDFSRTVVAHGLDCFAPRPIPTGPDRLRLRRRCAGELRLAAELSRRLDRPDPETQDLLRAARWIDAEDYDLASLVETGNLEIVDRLTTDAREAIRDAAGRDGRSGLVRALLAEYAGAA